MQNYLIDKINTIRYKTHQKIIIFLHKYIMIKFLVWWKIQGTCLNTKMSLYTKPIANIKLTGEKFKLIPLIPKLDKVVHSLYIYLFNILCKSLARAIRKVEVNTNYKGRAKILFLWRRYDSLYKWGKLYKGSS